jgi:hypothetical protein
VKQNILVNYMMFCFKKEYCFQKCHSMKHYQTLYKQFHQ